MENLFPLILLLLLSLFLRIPSLAFSCLLFSSFSSLVRRHSQMVLQFHQPCCAQRAQSNHSHSISMGGVVSSRVVLNWGGIPHTNCFPLHYMSLLQLQLQRLLQHQLLRTSGAWHPVVDPGPRARGRRRSATAMSPMPSHPNLLPPCSQKTRGYGRRGGGAAPPENGTFFLGQMRKIRATH
jgi:hypothetical protein